MVTAAAHGEPAWRALYPWTGKRFDRGAGVRMHYLDEGAGDPVVMVHGNPTWSFYFRALVRDLARDHRCIVPDHVGCGLSDKPGDDAYAYTLRSRVDDLEALLDHAGVTARVTLVVHDWGGMIGTAWAVRHPERVARIVLLNTAAFRLPAPKAFPGLLRLARDFSVGAWLVQRHNAFARGATVLAATRRKLAPAVAAGLVAPYEAPGDRIATLRFVQDIPLAPGDRAWDTVVATEENLGVLADRPALALWGMKDFVFDRHFLDVWIRTWPRLEVHRFDDAGHYVLEDAADEIVPLVREFLARHPIEAAGAR